MLEEIISYAHNLERVLDNLKEGIIAHDTHRRIFYFNQEAEKITGFSKEEVLGKDCHQAFGKPFCGSRCHFCSDQPALGDKEECITHIQTRQGEFRRIEMCVTAMADNQGALLGVLAAFRDVTGLLNLQLKADKFQGFADIIGQDAKMLEIFHQIETSPAMITRFIFPVRPAREKSWLPQPFTVKAREARGLLCPSTAGRCPKA